MNDVRGDEAGVSGALLRAAWLEAIVALAEDAGRAILDVYAGDFAVEFKGDASPLTAADLAAERIISDALRTLAPGVPVISEEAPQSSWQERRRWPTLWLVDPLDGTREFVKRNGEFTVNIALIEHHRPTLGVVHAPVTGRTAWAATGGGAWLRENRGGRPRELRVAPRAAPPWRIVGSRSHRDDETGRFLDAQGAHEIAPMGSSLKFIAIAAGDADLYVRFGPTSEWDTAAGECVLEAAGGRVVDMQGAPLRYNARETLRNPAFIACATAPLSWLARARTGA